jgi:polar amino acid transport system substrate-binding protein
MKVISPLVRTLVIGSVLVSGAVHAQDCPENLPVIAEGKLTMSINATIPPTQYIDEKGELVGLHREFGDIIAERLCLEPEYANVQFEVQIPGLQAKRWDMINTGLFFTEERSEIMKLVPYKINSLAVIGPSGNPAGVQTLEDLAGKVVGVEIAGFEEKKIREINDEQVAAGLESMDIRVFNTYGDTFLALGAGQVEAVFAGDEIGKYYENKGQFTKMLSGLFPGSPAAFAFDDQVLADAVVEVLQGMAKDGSYDELMDSFGITKIDTWDAWPGEFRSYYNGK